MKVATVATVAVVLTAAVIADVLPAVVVPVTAEAVLGIAVTARAAWELSSLLIIVEQLLYLNEKSCTIYIR